MSSRISLLSQSLRFFQRYLLPGFVFQSVVIAGGYGTGRELVEFFLSLGPAAGLLAMLVSTLVWSCVCAATFEFARRFSVFDYRRFFRRLLGRGWFLFEVCYLLLLLIVLAVIASAAGSIIRDALGFGYVAATIGMVAAIGALVFWGSRVLERFLSLWSILLYGVFAVFLAISLNRFGEGIAASFSASQWSSGWFFGGIEYAAYNLGTIPAVLFAIRHCKRRSEALASGFLAGPIAMLPGLFFYLCMAAQYPAILNQDVPAKSLLDALGIPWFGLLFQIVLFGTLIETGASLIHAVNERVDGLYRESGREYPRRLRPTAALAFLGAGALTAQIGLRDLIASGYGMITWGFLLVYVAPVLTVGVWKLLRAGREPRAIRA